MRRFPFNTLLLYGLTALRLLSPLAITPLLAHRMSVAELGTWGVCMSIASTAAVFMELGFGLSATREIANPRSAGPRAIFDAVTSTRAVSAVIMLPAIVLAVALQPRLAGATLPLTVLCVWLTAIAMGSSSLWFFQSQHRLAWSAALDAAGVAVGLLLVWLFAHGLHSALGANIASYAVPSLVGHAWVAHRLGSARLSLASARSGWRMTKALAQFRFVASTYTSAIPFMLSLSLAPSRIAPFYLAERVTRALAAMLVPVVQLLYPAMCVIRHDDPVAHRQRCLRWAWGLAVGAAAVALAVAFEAPRIASLVATAALAPEMTLHLRELVIYLVPLAISSVLGNLYMVPAGQDRAFNRVIVATAITGITLALWLPRTSLGASGASVSIVASEGLAALLMALSFAMTGATRRRSEQGAEGDAQQV